MKKKMRIVFDSVMILLLPLLMAYSLVGETVHEYLGIGMFLLFIAHHILNFTWWKHLFYGRYTLLRVVMTVINLALAIIMIALPISGMMMSRYVFHSLHFNKPGIVRTIHLLASYWGLILMSFHAGIHGHMMKRFFKMNQSSKIKVWSLRLFTLLLMICGIYTFNKNKITSYLFLRTQFVFIDFFKPILLVLMEYLLISILFMILGYGFWLVCLRRGQIKN